MRFANPSSIENEAAPEEHENGPYDEPTTTTPVSCEVEGDVDLSFLDPPMETGDLGRIAHYRVIDTLGVGGMGVVLRGEDTHLRRPVALKVMRKEFVDSYASRERFLQEARVAAAVESENIVTVYQVGMHNDVPFLAMQYLHGEALDERLNRSAPLPIPFALLIARQTAAGLADAHANGLVHRDIKPANIWLETDPASGKFRRVRLLDFGLARILVSNRKLTSMGVIVGTPQYMSPEQAFGSEVDGRADLFSLGAVMYAMFTGTLPFEGNTSAAVLMALVSHVPPRASTLNRQVPREADDLIERLLAKEPEKRPATADEVVEILDGMLIEFSTPILGRTSGVLGYPVRSNTFADARTTLPPPEAPAADLRGATFIGPQPTLTLPAPKPSVFPARSEAVAVAVPVLPLAQGSSAAFIATPTASPEIPPPRSRHVGLSWLNMFGWALLLTLTVLLAFGVIGRRPETPPTLPAPTPELRVGVLFAKSGPMAALEQSHADATLLAIDELNKHGGVLGRKVIPVEVDPGRTSEEYARQAEGLVKERGVAALFGAPASSDRRTLRPLIERYNAALFCPGPHEGLEYSTRIVYVGPTLTQFAVPAVRHLLAGGQRRFYVIGKDNVFSRITGAVIQDTLKDVPGAVFAGETYLPTDTNDFAAVLADVRGKKADVVVNAIQGGGAVVFVQQLRAAVPALNSRVLHLQNLEDYRRAVDPAAMAGDWVACTYLDGDSPEGRGEFATRFLTRYGPNRVVTDAMAAAYAAVHLWAKAAEAAGSLDPNDVLGALSRVELAGPFGTLKAVETGRHFRFPAVVGEFQPNGTVKTVFRTEPQDPSIYPPTRAPADWDRYLRQLYFRWGERWRGLEAK